MFLGQQQGRQPGQSPVRLSFALPTAEKAPPTEFRIFPAGEIATSKGTFRFTEKSAASVIAAAKQWGNRHSMDYEHRALTAMWTGEGAAPAAGWYDLEVRAGELWAVNVEWTERAKGYLTAREYRYFSPAFEADPESGEVLALTNIALTNLPATHAMEPLAASGGAGHPTTEAPKMKLLLKALGLAESATEAEALAALHAQQEVARPVLALTGRLTLPEALGVLASWKTSAESAETLRTELAKLQTEGRDREVLALVEQGKREGKIPPALVEFCTALGKKDPAQLKAYLDAAVPVVTTAGTAPRETAGGPGSSTALSTEDRAVAAQLGMDPKEFVEHRSKVLSRPGGAHSGPVLVPFASGPKK